MSRTLSRYVIKALTSINYHTGFSAPPSNPEKDSVSPGT